MIVSSEMVNMLNTAFQLIQGGTNEKVRQSEAILIQLRDDIQYPKVLFDYFQSYEVSLALRAAIEFKLWFKEYSTFDDYKAQYVSEVVGLIKDNLIAAYMNSEKPIAPQVFDATLSIAARDFPTQWPHLMSTLSNCLQQPNCILKSLKLIRKLTEKYVFSCRSDPLYEEIILTCNTLHNGLLLLAQQILQSIQQGVNLQLSYKILKSLLRVFYHLNFQDLHPHFEDNLQQWMEFMKLVLRLPDQQGLSSAIFKCKGESLKCVLLYALKYRDDFAGLIQVFSSEIWNVCTQATDDGDSDRILLNALKYFKSLVTWQDMRSFFEGNIKVLMESLIVKNIQLNRSENGTFIDEPQVFIETFFEQSDLDSRRAQAVDLYKSVSKQFPIQVNTIIQEYLQAFISSGSQNQDAEIIMINLIIDGATIAFIPRDGTIEIQLSPDLILGFYNHYLKGKLGQIYELAQQNQPIESKFPAIVLAFYCRFLFYFRNYIDKNEIISLAQVISKIQNTKKQALQDIASYTVDALLTVKANVKDYTTQAWYFQSVNINVDLQVVLTDVYNTIKQQQQLNQHSLKLTNTIITLLKQDTFNALDAISELLQDLLKKIKLAYEFQNVHIVFEVIANVIDIAIQSNNVQAANKLQENLLNQLDEMLRENKGDVVTFILQIYALFLQVQNNATQYYQGIVQAFLDINNWQESNQTVFPAYITYFEYWFKLNEVPVPQMQSILQLIVVHSSQQFTLLSDILIRKSQQWVSVVLQLIFNQYQYNMANQQQQTVGTSKSKANHLNQKLINKEVFLVLSNVFNTYGIQVLIQACAEISPQILEGFLLNELPIVKTISNKQERKVIFTMLTNLLFQGQQLSQQAWIQVFQAMVDNIYMKRRQPLKFMGRFQDREITSSSGFQPLKPIRTNKIIHDEDKYFCSNFKIFYSDPMVQQNLPVSQMINQAQQELISSLIQNV